MVKAAIKKPARVPKKVAPKASAIVETTEVEVETVELKKKDLVERVAAKADVKKKVARDVIEVVLAEIGAALSRGEGLSLPPLGKAKVNRQMEKGTGEVIVVKLRRGGGGGKGTAAAEEGLADSEE